MNFEKPTVGLHYIHILSMLAKFHGNQRSIVMLLINGLNSNFCNLKQLIKYEFMDHMVNNIRLACILSTYRICNSTMRLLKYEFNNKLLSGITLLRITSSVTLSLSLSLSIYILYNVLRNLKMYDIKFSLNSLMSWILIQIHSFGSSQGK